MRNARFATVLAPAVLAIASISAKAQDAPVDPRPLMATAVEKLIEAAPDLRTIDVAGFAAQGGHSLCASALTEALLVALDEEARNPNRALRDRPLTVRRASATAGEDPVARASGMLDIDQRGRAHMSLSFRRGDAVLAPTGRVAIAIDALGCDPTLRPFLDHVAAGARRDRAKLDVTAPVFTMGERLQVSIVVRQRLRLYCWILAEDGTGFVTLPSGPAETALRPATHRYPRDFRLEDIVLTEKFENLFGCFGVEGELPEMLALRWAELAASAERDAALIDAENVQSLMGEMRSQSNVTEAVARVLVR